MNNLEKEYLKLRLAEQAIIKESFEEKNAMLEDLETEVRYLKTLLNIFKKDTREQKYDVSNFFIQS